MEIQAERPTDFSRQFEITAWEAGAESQAWYAVHTRSRHERKVRRELFGQSMEAFLPEYITWSRRRDRRKHIMKALFPGYLFVRTTLTPDKKRAILKTPSVVRIVGVGWRPVPVPEHQVESIRILLKGASDASPCPLMKPGQLVQVMDGPMRGVVGMVERTQKKRIVVTVELVGRAVAACLDQAVLAPYFDADP